VTDVSMLGSRQGSPVGRDRIADRCGFKFWQENDGHFEFVRTVPTDVSMVLRNLIAIVQERRQTEEAAKLQSEVLELMRSTLAAEQIDALLAKGNLQDAVRAHLTVAPPQLMLPPWRTPPLRTPPRSPSPLRIASPQHSSVRLAPVTGSILTARSASPSASLLGSASCTEVPKVLEQSNGVLQERRVLRRYPDSQSVRLVNGQDRGSLGGSQEESSQKVLQLTETCGPPQRSRLSDFDVCRGDGVSQAMSELQKFRFSSDSGKPMSQGEEPESMAVANGDSSGICHGSSRGKPDESIASSPSQSFDPEMRSGGSSFQPVHSGANPPPVAAASSSSAGPAATNGNEAPAGPAPAAVPSNPSAATLTPAPMSPADSQADPFAQGQEARVHLGSSHSQSGSEAAVHALPAMERAQVRTKNDLASGEPQPPGSLAAAQLEATAAPAAGESVEVTVQTAPVVMPGVVDPNPFDGFHLTPLNAQPFQAISNIARKARNELVERLTPR